MMKKMSLKKELEENGGKIVSHGTLREVDLLDVCVWLVEKYDELRPKPKHPIWNSIDNVCELVEKEDLSNDEKTYLLAVVNYLFEWIRLKCPEGWYFGSDEGDGTLFGFWCTCPRCTDIAGCDEFELDGSERGYDMAVCLDCVKRDNCPQCRTI